MRLRKKKISFCPMSEEKHPNTIHSLRWAEIVRCSSCANSWGMEIIESDRDLKRQYKHLKNNPLWVIYESNGGIRYQR